MKRLHTGLNRVWSADGGGLLGETERSLLLLPGSAANSCKGKVSEEQKIMAFPVR